MTLKVISAPSSLNTLLNPLGIYTLFMHLEYIGNVIEGRGVVVDGENQIVDTTKIIRVNKCIEVYREKSRVRLFET